MLRPTVVLSCIQSREPDRKADVDTTTPARDRKERTKFLNWAEDFERSAQIAEQGGTIPNPALAAPVSAARYRAYAAAYRHRASLYQPEGE